jgi:hypothetical protein
MNSTRLQDTETMRKVVLRQKRRRWVFFALIAFVVAIVAVWVIWGLTQLGKSSDTTVTVSTQKVERSITGKSIDEDRKAALTSAQNILNLSLKSPTGANFQDRLKSLDSGDTKVVDPELVKAIRFKDSFDDSNEMKNNTYQSLITISTLINNSTGSSTVAPTSDTMWKNVYVDTELGTAFVPMAVFAGPSSSFSMEMVYDGGNWKLAPYSLLDSVKLSAKLQLAAEAAKTK